MLARKTPLKQIGKKPPRCPECKEPFVRELVGQKVCAKPECMIAWAKQKRLERRVAPYRTKRIKQTPEVKAFRENDKAHVAKQARSALHKWIVAVRDVDKPCVSSGRTKSAQWQAGHFRPGTQSMTRYDEANIHKQSIDDNYWRSGNVSKYEEELVRRVGQSEVDRIKASTAVKKWTIEELREIRDEYRQRLRDAGIPIPTTH